MTTKVTSSIDEPLADSAFQMRTLASEDCAKTLKDIRNNVEQLSEIRQSLTSVSRELVEELMKIIQLNNKPLSLQLELENLGDKEITVHPKGFVLIRGRSGEDEPKLLADLEPSLLHAVLVQLLPKLRDSLDGRKQSDEALLGQLIEIRESMM